MSECLECRDRPSQGAQPGSWIEQLVGRRKRFGFNKVTAVSTTGFAEGVKSFAQNEGIELREVVELSKEAFEDWFRINELIQINRQTILHHAIIIVDKDEKIDKIKELKTILEKTTSDTPFLLSIKTGKKVSLNNAFLSAVEEVGNLFEDVVPNRESKNINLRVKYENIENHFVVKTLSGNIHIQAIQFHGELKIIESKIPIFKTLEYRTIDNDSPISQIAMFRPQEIQNHKLSIEFHNLFETGETHILLKKNK